MGNESLCRELAYTGRTFGAAEAKYIGLVSRALGPGSVRGDVVEAAVSLGAEISRNSPIAVFGTKRNLLFARDHSVEDGLEYAATWNGAALQTDNFRTVIQAMKKRGVPQPKSKL